MRSGFEFSKPIYMWAKYNWFVHIDYDIVIKQVQIMANKI
jgi:hypothetical protein